MLGETIGHFRILEQLGAGGMGVVYRARDLRLERDVAIKVVRPEAATPALRQAFLREARMASGLRHPGIVVVHELIEHGDMDCIVMEYVAGQSLAAAIPAEGMGVERALGLAVGIGEALAAAHAAGVVHRDLKPANILVGEGDRVKILDFGLAKLVEGSREESPTRVEASLFGDGLVGTLSYLAPEGARGEAVDARADVFALGAIVYQMLSGRPAFTGPTAAAILFAVQTGRPRPLRGWNPAVPAALEAVVERALAKAVAERWASAREMVDALKAAGGADGTATRGLEAARPVPPARESARTSIAVLGFRSLSPGEDNAYLAAGLAAELNSALTGVPGLRIASQRAAMQLPETVAPREAAAALGVRHVLAGSVRSAGTRVRVSAELVDGEAAAGGGGVVWARNYDRAVTDLFAVQEDIARAIVKALGGELIRAASDFAFRAPTASLDAWGLARRAYHVWNYEFSLAGVAQALDHLRRAIELDPEYGYAHALLGLYLNTTVITAMSADPEADRREALAAVERACALAPEDPEVLASAALVWQHASGYERAVVCLKRAVRLAPFDLVAWGYLGFAHACAGGEAEVAEARTILARLVADAPEHPSLAFWHEFAAIAALREGDYKRAAEHGRLAVEMQPGFVFNQVFQAEALCRLGRVEEARAVLAGIPVYNPHFTLAGFEAVALGACRRAETVDRLCGEIRKLGIFPAG